VKVSIGCLWYNDAACSLGATPGARQERVVWRVAALLAGRPADAARRVPNGNSAEGKTSDRRRRDHGFGGCLSGEPRSEGHAGFALMENEPGRVRLQMMKSPSQWPTSAGAEHPKGQPRRRRPLIEAPFKEPPQMWRDSGRANRA
jgi:hypothetical protein